MIRSGGRRAARGGAVAVLTALLAACAQTAGFLFDLPPKTAAAAPAAAAPVAQDTVRPPIEQVGDPDSVLALLPRHADGGVDWMAALRAGVIAPRPGTPGRTPPAYLEGFAYDLVMPGANRLFDARFPHSSHVAWMACGSCHPGAAPAGGAAVTMAAMRDGQSCGLCHRAVAFPLAACSRCHGAMPSGTLTPVLGDEIILARAVDAGGAAAAGYAPSRFSHGPHRLRYRCSACHTALFEMRAGADTLTMADLRDGKGCGACHDGRAAFAMGTCARCHVEPQ